MQAERGAGAAAGGGAGRRSCHLGWTEDQRWTLARVTALIGRLFHVTYTPRGVSYLLHRLGWSPQAPQRKAAERDEEAIATWMKDTWPLAGQRRGIRTRGAASPTKQAHR
ncbi:helix-turn-helix domain-containing protein [Nonomuraea salmonea]|uniref:helix-turn-helix domain-containing protein n=1 Tax=Nonomuraea salmonea TaxID=46181 RepID=UPI003CD08542